MGFGSVKVLCKSKVTVIVCCGVSKVTQQLPFYYQSVMKWLGITWDRETKVGCFWSNGS